MPQIINTNMASINTQRNLDKTQSASQVAMQRLSSGLRINSAKDDAAGLAISTRFISQIQGLNVAVRNAGDGIALAQTAEGALGTMTENLQRIRELAVQSSNATNSDVDREALQAEVSQLIQEITRTASETDFNGRKLLDGTFTGTFQVGANAGQVVDITIAKLTADRLGVGTANGVSAIGNNKGLQNGDLVINGVAIDPSKPSADTYSVTDPAASAIAKVAAINAKSEATGVTAVVNTNVALGSKMVPAATAGTLTLNGVQIGLSTGGIDINADRDAVIASINAKSGQTGVIASNGGDGSGVVLKAADGRNITAELGGALTESSTGLSQGTTYGGYTLISKNGSNINIQGGQGTGTGDIRNAGLTVGTYSGREAAVVSSTTYAGSSTTETASTFTTGPLNITGTKIINATNNQIEVAVNGADFELLTLGTNFDAGSVALPPAGKYDNAAQLAAQINNAITDSTNNSYAANAAFRDSNGNALFTASATADGQLVFTTVDKGADTSIVARTGAGNVVLPTATIEKNGTDAGDVWSATINFKFDGNNVFSAAGDFTFTPAGGTPATVAVAVGPYTAAEFADLLNNDPGFKDSKLTASIGDDGVSVIVSTNPSVPVTGFTIIATAEATPLQNNYQQLSNGSSVITDVNEFAAAIAAATDSNLGISVNGAPAQELNLGTAASADYDAYAANNVPPSTYTADLAAAKDQSLGAEAQAIALAKFLNNVMAVQTAGTGATATAVGDQVVLSSISGGPVALSQAGSNPIGTQAVVAPPTATSEAVDATNGTAQTGNFSVDSEGNFVGAGSDVANPLIITAGKNDTFSVALNGAAAQDVTIAAGSYANLTQLADSINAGYVQAASVINVATLSSTLADYDFTTTADNLVLDIELDGAASQTITLAGNYTTTPATVTDVADAQTQMLSALQTQLDTTFGANKVLAGIDNGVLQLSRVGGSSAGSVVVSSTLPAFGAGSVVDGSTIPAMTVTVAEDNQSLIFTSGLAGATSSVDITNGTFAVEGGEAAGVLITNFTPPQVLETGDLLINGTAIQGALAKDDTYSDTTALSSVAAGSGIAVAAAINKSTAQTGVTASVNSTILTGGLGILPGTPVADAGSTGRLIINNVETTIFSLTGDEGRDRQSTIESINAISGRTGVVATDNGESITLTAADGRNISVAIDNQLAINAAAGRDSSNFGNAIGLNSSLPGIGEADISGTEATYANTAGTTYSTVTLVAAKGIEIAAGENGAEKLAALGLQAGTFGGGENGMFLKDIDISTFQGAQAAIMAIDNALGQVSSQRADLGAIQNRMESTVSNLRVTSENLSAANSRIRDADFAAETAALAKAQVLQQAGISILAQANASGQQVLSLLG